MLRRRLRGLGDWVYRQPYILLILTTLFWGGNVVAGKLAVGHVSPMAMTFLRWLIACAGLAVVVRGTAPAEWRRLLAALPFVLVMALFGFTAFNALFYAAAHHTTAVNIAIIQGSTPIFVFIGTMFLGARFNLLQMAGILTTIAGILLTASRGDLGVLLTLAFNRGDTWLLVASVLYALYTLGLRWRPQTSGLTFFTGLAAAACLTSIPLLVYEGIQGDFFWPTPWGWVIVFYVGLLPSLLCQVFYIRGVELIGPSRAGTFYNLVPVFGALLSTVILDEPFSSYHVLALALVLGGIAIAERGRSKG